MFQLCFLLLVDEDVLHNEVTAQRYCEWKCFFNEMPNQTPAARKKYEFSSARLAMDGYSPSDIRYSHRMNEHTLRTYIPMLATRMAFQRKLGITLRDNPSFDLVCAQVLLTQASTTSNGLYSMLNFLNGQDGNTIYIYH